MSARGTDAGAAVTVGVISDTHGLLRPEAIEALAGSARIVHAGDVGNPAILEQLARLAPVTAVRGNVDTGAWASALPETAVLEAGGVSLYVLHDLAALDLSPESAGFRVVVFGHSHQPGVQERRGVLFFNPGSAGPRRFRLPISVGRLTISDGRVVPQLLELSCGPADR